MSAVRRLATRLPALLLAALFAVFVAGCASQRGLATRAVPLDAQSLKAGRSLAQAATGAWPQAGWWKRYGDPQLDRLVEEALAANPAMRIARARLDKANALVAGAASAQSAQVTGGLDATRQRFSENSIYPPPLAGTWRWQNQLALNANYEFDFWGRNRAAYDAALGQARASEADGQAASLLLSTSVVRTWLQLQRAWTQRDLARAALALRTRMLDLAHQRVAAGLDSQVDLTPVEAVIPAAREQVVQLDEAIQIARNQLAALAGQGPDRGLTVAQPAPPASGLALMGADASALLPSSLPADLIGRRPDVIAQRWRVEAAAQDRKSAQAQFYPNINLAAFAGLQSLGFSRWIEAGSEIAGIGPAIRLPIFDGGRLRANLAGRNADYDLAVEQYNQTVIDAVRDVADQIGSLRAVEAQEREIAAGLALARQARTLADERFRAGLSSYVPVLAAEAQVLSQQSLAADARARALDLSVNLIRALGGAYETPAAGIFGAARTAAPASQ